MGFAVNPTATTSSFNCGKDRVVRGRPRHTLAPLVVVRSLHVEAVRSVLLPMWELYTLYYPPHGGCTLYCSPCGSCTLCTTPHVGVVHCTAPHVGAVHSVLPPMWGLYSVLLPMWELYNLCIVPVHSVPPSRDVVLPPFEAMGFLR